MVTWEFNRVEVDMKNINKPMVEDSRGGRGFLGNLRPRLSITIEGALINVVASAQTAWTRSVRCAGLLKFADGASIAFMVIVLETDFAS